MYQDSSVDNNIKKSRKRKIRRPSGRKRNSDSSDSDSGPCVGVELKFSLSQSSQKSFSELFAEAQATLRQHTSKFNASSSNDEELPSIDEDSPNPDTVSTSPRKKVKKRRKKGSPQKNKDRKTPAVTLAHARSTSNGQRGSSSQVSSSYLNVANLDTDTELDYVNQQDNTNADERGVEEILLSSSDDDEYMHKLSYAYNTYETRHNHVTRPIMTSNSHIPVVVVSSRSPSPESDSGPPELDLPPNLAMKVRIRYRNKLYEFDGNRLLDMEKVREKFSEMIDVPESELLLYDTNEQKLVDGKTLLHYEIAHGDVLEALRRNTDKPVYNVQALISLKFQKEGLKQPVFLNVSKYSSLKEIRTRVAKEIKVEEKNMFFRIDGEKVNMCKTPDELDLEDDICVDIYEKR